MSQRPGVSYAIALVLVANLAPLAAWWWNRSGSSLSTVELSEREVGVRWGGDENSSVWLRIWLAEARERIAQPAWADSASLAAVGFEPARLSSGTVETLAAWRPVRRPVWVLLRLQADAGSEAIGSRLVPVAVGTDPGALSRRAGDRTEHLVLRGVVRVARESLPADSLTGLATGESWYASLDLITPSRIHVPRSLIPALEDLAPEPRPTESARYQARLHSGRLHLPWITAIFPATP